MTMMVKNGVFKAPSGFKVRGESYRSLEIAASELRPQLPMIQGSRFSLNCIRIFEQTLPKVGYQYRTIEIEDSDECAAFTIPSESIVVLRIDVYDKLQSEQVFGRSTVIHELSHIVLQHHVTLHRGAVLGTHKHFEDSEWQAKTFTAAVMMPLEAAKIARSPQEFADLCGTSVEAATYRINTLVRLKLLTPNHMLWRYAAQQ